MADWLARGGLHLSASSVGRFWKRECLRQPPPKASRRDWCLRRADEVRETARQIVSRRPGHTIHVDITTVPVLGGFWCPWVPQALAALWPWAWHVVAVTDHFSRRLVAIEAFRRSPTGKQVCGALDVALGVLGEKPKYIISDQGVQFRSDYRDWCDAHRIRPRFGKLFAHGSIARIERFFKSLKYEGLYRISVPSSAVLMQAELIVFGRWYNSFRPHRALGGATPDEIFFGKRSVRRSRRIEPRARYPARGARRVPAEHLRLVTKGFEGRAHLEVVRLEIDRAA